MRQLLKSFGAAVLYATAPSKWTTRAVGNPRDALFDLTFDEIKVTNIPQEYDYVIVGGGGGGMLMAMRLAEDPRISVAVVEAGTLSTSFFTYQPGQLATSNFVDPTIDLIKEIDWLDQTVPMKVNDQIQHYPQGKMIGGSTARGFSAYTRGSVGSYQKWADMVNDTAYTWDEFYPYLRKSVLFTPPNIQLRGENTSDILFDTRNFDVTGGPMHVSFSNYAAPFATWMKQAVQELGVPPAVDFNNGSLAGVQYLNTNVNPLDQHRSYAADFFEEARARPNLAVFAHTTATKITFEGGNVATGIQAMDAKNASSVFRARKEVIISAGVFRTPQLLMVSGIGPAKTLQDLDIPVIADLPRVGQNLQDRVFVGTTYQVNMNTSSQAFNADFAKLNNDTLFPKGLGILTGTVDMAFFESVPPDQEPSLSPSTRGTLATYPPDWPVFQYLPVNADLLLFRNIASKPPTGTAVVPNFGSIAATIAAPQSRGSVTIRSANFSDPPVIDIGYLSDERDIELLTVAFRRSRQVWKQPSLKPALIGDEYWPGYALVPDDDAAIRRHIVENPMPIWEATATCAMGTDPSNGAIDSRARVFGVQRLRVVDASSLPFSPPGHPASSVFGLAERVAAWAREDFDSLPAGMGGSAETTGTAPKQLVRFPIFLIAGLTITILL